MGRLTILTPEIQKGIVKLIRAGAYDYQAAQAHGITPQTFYRWIKAGSNGNGKYRSFCDDVRQARADARTSAEVEVKKDNALAWLRYGPGRERPGEPGWTESVKHEIAGDEKRPLIIKYVDGNKEA